MAGTGITGMLITFVGGIILIMVLVIVLILYHKRQVERTSAPFSSGNSGRGSDGGSRNGGF